MGNKNIGAGVLLGAFLLFSFPLFSLAWNTWDPTCFRDVAGSDSFIARTLRLLQPVARACVLIVAEPTGGFPPPPTCGDERDQLIQEYTDYGVTNLHPTCSDFTQTAHSEHFTFAELNWGTYSWAIIRQRLLDGLEAMRTEYGGPLTITSGYRNPAKDATFTNPPNQYPNGQHRFGLAADISSNSLTWLPLSQAGKRAGACVEPLAMSGFAHVHVDWRSGGCPDNW